MARIHRHVARRKSPQLLSHVETDRLDAIVSMQPKPRHRSIPSGEVQGARHRGYLKSQ